MVYLHNFGRSVQNKRHPHERAALNVPKVSFNFVILLIHFLNGVHPSFIKNISAKLDKAGAQSVGNAFSNPYPDLCVTLHRIFPPIRFLNANAKNSHLRFHTHGSTKFFRMFAIGPRWDHTTACLLIGKKKSECCPVMSLSGNPFGIYRAVGFCLRISASHKNHNSFNRFVRHTLYWR